MDKNVSKVERKLFEKVITFQPFSTNELVLILQSRQNPVDRKDKEIIIKTAREMNYSITYLLHLLSNLTKEQQEFVKQYEEKFGAFFQIMEKYINKFSFTIQNKLIKKYGEENWKRIFSENYLNFIKGLLVPYPTHYLILSLSGGVISPIAYAKYVTKMKSDVINILLRYYQFSIHNWVKKLQQNPLRFKEDLEFLVKKYGIMVMPFRVGFQSHVTQQGVQLYFYKVPNFLKNQSFEVIFHYYYFSEFPFEVKDNLLNHFDVYSAILNIRALIYLKKVEGVKVQEYGFEKLINEKEFFETIRRGIRAWIVMKEDYKKIPYFSDISPINWMEKVKDKFLTEDDKKMYEAYKRMSNLLKEEDKQMEKKLSPEEGKKKTEEERIRLEKEFVKRVIPPGADVNKYYELLKKQGGIPTEEVKNAEKMGSKNHHKTNPKSQKEVKNHG